MRLILILCSVIALGACASSSSPEKGSSSEAAMKVTESSERVICRREKKIGTRVGERVCRTEAQIEADREASKETIRERRSTGPVGVGPGQ